MFFIWEIQLQNKILWIIYKMSIADSNQGRSDEQTITGYVQRCNCRLENASDAIDHFVADHIADEVLVSWVFESFISLLFRDPDILILITIHKQIRLLIPLSLVCRTVRYAIFILCFHVEMNSGVWGFPDPFGKSSARRLPFYHTQSGKAFCSSATPSASADCFYIFYCCENVNINLNLFFQFHN